MLKSLDSRLQPRGEAEVLNRVFAHMTAQEMLGNLWTRYRGEVAMVSSFGAESAVLLHMIGQAAPDMPVLFLETGMLFPETLAYQEDLARRFKLTDVRRISPDGMDLEMLDPDAGLHRENPDGCCYIRKTLPLRRALAPFKASITGRKRHQGPSRADMALVEAEVEVGRIKVNPLADWTRDDLRAYADRHDLPPHPLVSKGFPSIGCLPCTTPVAPDEDPRAGRWRGSDKTECGIHFDGKAWVQTGPDRVRRSFT